MKYLRQIIILVCFLLIICSDTVFATNDNILESQQESLGISAFIEESEKYTKDVFEDMDVDKLLKSAMKGEVNNDDIVSRILELFGDEIKSSIRMLCSVIVVIVIHSILKSISEGLENKSISQITYYVQYILIITLIMSNFSGIIDMTKESIQNLVGFSHTLLPILITLMITTGSITSASIVQPILLFLITFIGNIVTTILLPLVLVGTCLGIISKISDRVQIDKIAKFFKSGVVWVLGVALTLFVGVLSIEGSLSSSVDGITAKTAKAAVSNFIPVVGKILGDAVDTVIGCASILKSAVGIVGVIVVISICVVPIIKLTILTITYHLTAAVCEPIADGRITSILSQMGDTFKTLLAIMFSVSVMLMIGITLVVKISNSGLMYR